MDLENAVLDAGMGAVMFAFFGFWFAIWCTYVGLTWALRLLGGITFRGRW